MNEIDRARLSLIPTLAERHPDRYIGRTALMKYLYFLQTLRGVPLGYDFSMYSYGPFDAEVLSQLGTAESLNLVTSTPVSFAGGYGYQIKSSSAAEMFKKQSGDFLSGIDGDLNWLIAEFGSMNSAELELASTIVYVDREFQEHGAPEDRAGLIGLVNEIKPHFKREQVERMFDLLHAKGILVSV